VHQEALNAVLKDVADRLREKQNASKRAAAAAGRKDGRDADGMDVDEPGGGDGRNKGRKYVWFPPPPSWIFFPSQTQTLITRRAPQEMVKAKTKRNRN